LVYAREIEATFLRRSCKKNKEEFGTNVTSLQCQNKFNGIVKDCKVSKLLNCIVLNKDYDN